MIIAVTHENGQVFQHFGRTKQFLIYTVEENTIRGRETLEVTGEGHGALAGLLKSHRVDVLICGGIGAGARTGLAEAGITLYPGASGGADEQVAALLAGTLQYDPDVQCTHHHGDHDHHGHGGHSGGLL